MTKSNYSRWQPWIAEQFSVVQCVLSKRVVEFIDMKCINNKGGWWNVLSSHAIGNLSSVKSYFFIWGFFSWKWISQLTKILDVYILSVIKGQKPNIISHLVNYILNSTCFFFTSDLIKALEDKLPTPRNVSLCWEGI